MDRDLLAEIGNFNLPLIEQLYSNYQKDPSSIDPSWRKIFDNLDIDKHSPLKDESSRYLDTASLQANAVETHTLAAQEKASLAIIDKSAPASSRIYHLIQAYRKYGHLMAKVNPIATHQIEVPWQLKLEALGFDHDELNQEFPTNGLLPKPKATLQEVIDILQKIYCDKIGIEYMDIDNPQMEQWLQQHIEPRKFRIDLSIDQKKMILQYLNKSELFESFIHTKYVGQKRFSIEGAETLIPMLASILENGSELGMQEFVLGMAHRGRLNVLANILQKSYATIFSEFEEGYVPLSFEGTGDVKYHKGFSSEFTTENGHKIKVDLSPNPSHLEFVDPVVEGLTKAKQLAAHDEQQQHIVPILIHGDAAIAGQGIVYETLQLYNLAGYSTGGTIHIVINNQIGFTTLPSDARSTPYCTDIAKTFQAPVFHVNAEDPEGCVYATILAIELRQKFHCEVFIDLVCYRKYGHNEADEPAFTQPQEYQLIRKKKPIREIYRDELIQQGVLERKIAEELEAEFKKSLQEALTKIKIPEKAHAEEWIKKAEETKLKEETEFFKPIETGVSEKKLQEIVKRFTHIPKGMLVHPKLEKGIKDREAMAHDTLPIDWGMGEMLAYGSLLWEGIPVRLAGQDVCRGTFSHRHAVWMHQGTAEAYFPLQHLKEGQGRFDVINSPLSESACLGFEYGYSLGEPNALVIWEAQFGDFVNGAQVIIDQFIASAEQKWNQKGSVVLFLPHGYEGQGPEHSSARIERFLSLCGDNNMQVVYPTSPAQLFHLLRRHVLRPMLKPLIVFTPKALLRLHECTNKLEAFTKGSFQEVIDDLTPSVKTEKLVFCSGKIYYELIEKRQKENVTNMTIIRIEQLYPFYKARVDELIKKYASFKTCYWVQEEPSNMGAWNFVRPILRELLPNNIEPTYVGRPRSASPAAGSYLLHKKTYAEMMKKLFSEKGGVNESRN